MASQIIYSKKYNALLYRFVLSVTLFTALSCSTGLRNNKIEGNKIPVTADQPARQDIENFVAPYRTYIDNDLDIVLAFNPETLDKSKSIEKWQTGIGNWMADVTFQYADKVFFAREKKHVDACLLNHGGIRAIMPQGNVTARTAYEIMPFENSLIIIALKGEQLNEIAQYFAKEKKPHPLSGMRIILGKDGSVKSISVNGAPVVNEQVYYVATSDYLSNGGDNMAFFKKGVASYDMNYKLRNLLIDYFKDVDTITASKTIRVSEE
ncbi:5'-nucleotidase C-terminal domain-containing protein [Flavobacterium cyanobacteriorum]|uniref:5'-nucleotidase C-terminal domain-containing protein n=1 Tax=Flavobacterium cyanobacteriorum TaxID=2022802 RepID=UPI001FAFDDD7|nr:5'-nucleotidase [Flavobacterium cyanobacteriorum]